MVNSITSTRDGFGKAMLELGRTDPNVVALCADLSESLRLAQFQEKFPDRYFEAGVAEQNMVGVAAGLALAGKIPFAASYAAFVPCRSYDQIRISVAYNNANVKLVGGHAGLTTGADGATHQTLEDTALMRTLPNMTVIVPADAREAYLATLAAAKHKGPVYLRLGKYETPEVTASTEFKIGRAEVLREGEEILLVSCGIMVYEALMAAAVMARHGVEATVVNCHTIKPLDQKTILAAAKPARVVVTVEDAQIGGGLGGAVAELLSQKMPKPVKRIGVEDRFGVSGKPKALLKKFGLDHKSLANSILHFFR